MVQITGKISGNITGLVRATPDHPFIDNSTNPPTLVVSAYEATITSSTFTLTLPQTQNLQGVGSEGVTYKWELFETRSVISYYLLDGTTYIGPVHQWATDSKWYTGSVHDTTSRLLDRVVANQNIPIQDPFHAIAPDSATPVPFTSLIGIPSQFPWFDIGLSRLAELLTTVATYRDRISSKFAIRGAYAVNTIYSLNDIVSFNGNSYVWRSATPAQNQQPPTTGDNANWLMIAAKGATGGTGAQIVGYNATNWTGSSEAAARGDVRDAIASIPNPDLSNYLTVAAGLPRNNPVMTGAVKRPALAFPVAGGEKGTEVPTAQYVEDAIASLGTGKLPSPLIFAKRASVITLGQDVRSTVIWNPRVINQGAILDSNGIITIAEAGSYLFMVSLQATITGNYQSSQGQVQIRYRSILANVGTGIDAGDFFNYTYGATQATFTNKQQGFRLEQLSAGTTLDIDVTTTAIGASSVISSSQIDGSAANNYLMVWRVA
jgi:hypothetical protein